MEQEYQYLLFMRKAGRNKRQWYIADYPYVDVTKMKVNNPDPFILVRVSSEDLGANPQLHGERFLKLKIEQLQAQYEDTPKQYMDEDGVIHDWIEYGVFSEHGVSDIGNTPIITIDDVEVVAYE